MSLTVARGNEPDLHVNNIFQTRPVLYQLAQVKLRGPKGTVLTHALLDTGSAFTLLDEATSKQLGLKGESSPLSFATVAANGQSSRSSIVNLEVTNTKAGNSYKLGDVRTFPNLRLSGGTLSQEGIDKWNYLRGIPIEPYKNARPTILIGLPHSFLLEPLKVVKGRNGPTAVQTRLGWTLFGKIPIPMETEVQPSINHLLHDSNQELHNLVKDYFALEEVGIQSQMKLLSKEDKRAEFIAKTTLRKLESESRYEIGLLWKSDEVQMPDSRANALKRLYSMERKMDNDPEFGERYLVNFSHYLTQGYIRELSNLETSDLRRAWYLPHFAVNKPHKPGKIRLVFDAAAISNGTSLNQELLKGPDILTPLPAVISRFRHGQVAINADIKEMFHQVKVIQKDKGSQRLLWRGKNRKDPPKEFVMDVMTFGSTCSPYCAQLVKNTNALTWKEKYPRAAEAVINRHYVDDYLDSVSSVEEAHELFNQVMEIQRSAGYELCNWTSNSPEFLNAVPESSKAKKSKFLTAKEPITFERILGLRWDSVKDTFVFAINFPEAKSEVIRAQKRPTKRELLSVVMSLYDPLGMISHLTIKGKIILQQLWRTKLGWDEEVPDSIFFNWRQWLKNLDKVSQFNIPRCYSLSFLSDPQIQMHTFCDASETAYAAVCYLRVTYQEQVTVSFAAAKAKVTPLKSISIPRAELEAALLGSRLAKSVCEWNGISPYMKRFWTDSRTVLCWVKMDGGILKAFVAHRVGEIQELTEPNEWKWLPTHLNVADDATRLETEPDLSATARWKNGPSFLSEREEEWPVEPSLPPQVDNEVLEVKKPFVGVSQEDSLIILARFSKWMKLIRTTSLILRGRQLWKKGSVLRPIEPDKMKIAEQYWWRRSQMNSFSEELGAIRLKKRLPGRSRLSSLSVYLDENSVLRLNSRVQTSIGNLVRSPVILDEREVYTALLIKHKHEQAGHHGMDQVANDLKHQYHIVGLRAAVKRTWRDCQHCKNERAKPRPPQMAPVLSCRLGVYQRPFTFTGVDYFGPMEVTIGRRREKRYGALFTCLTIRAVHIEIAGSLNSDSLILAIRRFVGRRGSPKEIFSDNGLNFVGAERELRQALQDLNQDQITIAMANRGIKWRFIPPFSLHMGGSWERMVRAVKTSLHFTLKSQAPREETLSTLMVEAETSVNGHPLTYVSSDPEAREVLTPNHFLLGTPNGAQPPGIFTDKDLVLNKQWRRAQRLADHFWKRWLSEFLPTLTCRQKWQHKTPPIRVGDIVIIADETHPRNHWPKGRVVEIPDTKDGQVRWAMVKTGTGTYKRPTVKLCVLDVKHDREVNV